MKKIVFVSPVLEHPAAGGPQLRIENTIKALSTIAELHIVSLMDKQGLGGDVGETFYRGYTHSFSYAPSITPSPVRKVLYGIARRIGVNLRQRDDAMFLRRMMERIGADILWVGYGNVSYPLISAMRAVYPAAKIVCDTDSVWSRFILRELEVEIDPARRESIARQGAAKEIEERQSAAICDVTTAVSEVDASYYRDIASSAEQVHICSNVIDLDTYTTHHAPPAGFINPALFLGGSYYDPHSPMVRAAQWVVAEVMPHVWSRHPNTHLYLVGRGSDTHCRNLAGPNVTVTGKVETVLPYLQNSVCSLVPLQFESGTRFKILESGACRKALVSTTLGAEGIPVTHGQDILIADTAQEFAQAIVSLIDNPDLARKLGEECRTLVDKNYSLTSLSREIASIIDYLTQK